MPQAYVADGWLTVRTTLAKHGALWQRFLNLSAELDGQLAEATQQFLVEHCETSER